MTRTLPLLAALLIAAPGFTLAHPVTEPEALSVRVTFGDLDTSTPAGAAALFRRLNAASRTVCRNFESRRQLELIVTHADCMEKALQNAIADVNRPQLTAYSLARGVHLGPFVINLAWRD